MCAEFFVTVIQLTIANAISENNGIHKHCACIDVYPNTHCCLDTYLKIIRMFLYALQGNEEVRAVEK